MPRKSVFAYSTIQELACKKTGLQYHSHFQVQKKLKLDSPYFKPEYRDTRIKDKKITLIINIAREKIIREGWQGFSLRGLNRILKRYNIFYENYFANKTWLGFYVAEDEFCRLSKNLKKIQKNNPQYYPGQLITEYSQALINWSKYNQNILDIILSQEIIEIYSELKKETAFTVFVQNLYSLFYKYHTEEKQGEASDPYELLRIWFYFFFGLTRGRMFPLVEQLSNFRTTESVDNSAMLSFVDRIMKR